MKKKHASKLSLSRETVSKLDGAGLLHAQLRHAAGGTARSACGSCPPLSCVGTHCCGPGE
jgi:hypothetical protein